MGEIIGGRYELLDPVASGASGAVWRAGDHRSGMLCAAKVMRQRESADMMRFVREKSIRLHHRHLLTPEGFVADDDHVVIGMPLASGGTLADLVSTHGPLSDHLAALILGQLLSGLACLHEQGWIHRDVKPGNLLFEPVGSGEPVCRLADFGITVHESDVRLTATGFVNGTPGYVAPEVSATGDISPAQDLWAAGVCGLAMIAPGTKVTGAGSSEPQLSAFLEQVRAPLGPALASLLHLDPSRRAPDLLSMSETLMDFGLSAGTSRDRAGGPVVFTDHLEPLPAGSPWSSSPVVLADSEDTTLTARPRTPIATPSPPAPPGPRSRRRPVLLVLAAVVLLVAALPATVAVRGGLLSPEDSELSQRDPAIAVGIPCGWMEEGMIATAGNGTEVVCTVRQDGTYRWQRS